MQDYIIPYKKLHIFVRFQNFAQKKSKKVLQDFFIVR